MAPSDTILFVHGGAEGAHEADVQIADALQRLLPEERVSCPMIAALEALDGPKALAELTALLGEMAPDTVVVAHSLGGNALLRLLAEGVAAPEAAGLFILAAPCILPGHEWSGDEFTVPVDVATRLGHVPIAFYQGTEDEYFPTDHLHEWAAAVPQARAVEVEGQGHQFDKRPFTELARDITALRRG